MTKRVAKLIIKVRPMHEPSAGAEPCCLFSRKHAPGKASHERLELLGGKLDAGESPFCAMLREALEEEATGRLAREIALQRPAFTEVTIRHGRAEEPHFLFVVTVDEELAQALQPDPRESSGFHEVPISRILLGAKRQDAGFTPKTLSLLGEPSVLSLLATK